MPKPKEESTVQFIEYVKFYRLLWDKSDPDHKDFNKRSDAWNAIATFCGFENGEMAKRKWKHLTTARLGAQKLIEGSDGNIQCDYLYAHEMNFLDGIKKRKRRRPMDNYSDTFNEDFPHSSADYITINDESSEPSINGNINGNIEKSSIKHLNAELNMEHNNTNNDELLTAIEAVISNSGNTHNSNTRNNEEETEGSLFGRLIGQRLDRLEPKKRAKVQIEIQSLLYRHEFGD